MAANQKIVKDLIESIKTAGSAGTEPYDTTAEVVRVEDGVAWVHIPGGVDETPVEMSINAKEGDTVRVRVSGGQAWMTGNNSAPPTDDTMAKEALEKAGKYPDVIETGRIQSHDGQSYWDLDKGVLNLKGFVTSVTAMYAISSSPTVPPEDDQEWSPSMITSIPPTKYLWRKLNIKITAEDGVEIVEMIASGSGDLAPIAADIDTMNIGYVDSSSGTHEYALPCLRLYPETLDPSTEPPKINLTYGKVETTDGATIAVPASCLAFASFIRHKISELDANFYLVYRAGVGFLLVYYDDVDAIWKGAFADRGTPTMGTVVYPGGVEVISEISWTEELYHQDNPHFDLDAQYHFFLENNTGGGMIHYSNLLNRFTWRQNDIVLASLEFGMPTTIETISYQADVQIVPVSAVQYYTPARRVSDLDEYNASYTQKKKVGTVNLLEGTETKKTVTQHYFEHGEAVPAGEILGLTNLYPIYPGIGRSDKSINNVEMVTLSYEWSLATKGTDPQSFTICIPYENDAEEQVYIELDTVTIGASTGGSRTVTVNVKGLEEAVGGKIAIIYEYGELAEGETFTPSRVTIGYMQLEVGEYATDWSRGQHDDIIIQTADGDRDATPGIGAYRGALRFQDKNGKDTARIRTVYNPSGATGLMLEALKNVGGTDYSNIFGMTVTAAGGTLITLDADAWLSALGLTPTAWATDKIAKYRKQGNVVTVTYSDTPTDVQIPAGTWTTLATLPAGFRPSTTIYTTCAFRSGNALGIIRITSGGLVQGYTSNATGAIASGVSAYFNTSFIAG